MPQSPTTKTLRRAWARRSRSPGEQRMFGKPGQRVDSDCDAYGVARPTTPPWRQREGAPEGAAGRALGLRIRAGMQVLRLPLAVAPIFEDWLARNVPASKAKVLGRIRVMRGGKLSDARFGKRMRGEGILAEQIGRMFRMARRKAGLAEEGPELSVAAFRRPAGRQMELKMEG